MKLTILGPTGKTGRELIVQALAAGYHVKALVRDADALEARERLTIVCGALNDARALDCALAGSHAVLSALGGRPWRRRERVCSTAMRRVIPQMQEHRIRRLIAVSTFGAGDTRAHLGWISRHVLFGGILRTEVADKEAMESLLAASTLQWTTVRVGVLTDDAARGRWRVADDGSIREMNEIARADVAAFMLGALKDDTWIGRRPVLMY